MGGDTIEQRDQTQMRHHTLIKLLQSLNKQKSNQAKFEVVAVDFSTNSAVKPANNTRKKES